MNKKIVEPPHFDVWFFILILCFFPVFSFSQKGFIHQLNDPSGWIIRTKSSAYQLFITSDKRVIPVFFGPEEQANYGKKNASWFDRIEEIPVRGKYPFKVPVLEVVYNDHVRDADLEYVKGEVVEIDKRPALKIVQKDRFYPLQITSFIRVLEEFDVLEKWVEVSHTGSKGRIKVEKLLSGSVVLPVDEYHLTQLSGKELTEFQSFESLLTPGLKTIENRSFKSNQNAPWFMVRPKRSSGEENGAAWYGTIHYSGNWQLAFDQSFGGGLQVLGGINFWDTEWNLKPGTTLQTPKFAIGFTLNGATGAAQNLTTYARKEVLPAEHRNELRPVLYNSWEATYYKVNEKEQIDLARKAKELGIELFVIDDGWFKDRTDGRSQSGLGNWEVDKNKFPNGLAPVIKEVHNLGMKFGLWVEPENVNPNSDVYKAHPDWVFHFPNRQGNVYRKILNLGNEEVYQHLLQSLTRLLKENEIDFIKWDQNNYLSEPGWPTAPVDMQREVRIRHINNVYRLVEELRKRFPRVLFETCSSGGGRVDLGMLSRMDQAWVSDNTDPIDRLYIQHGYLGALPANTMVSWVTSTVRRQPISLGFRFDVSMAGVLGIGSDIRKWTPAEVEIAKNKIAVYKGIRSLVQQGNLFRLLSPYEHNKSALQYNSDDSASSVILCYNLASYLPGSQLIDRGATVLKLKGLDPKKHYTFQKAGDEKDKGTIYPGDFLTTIGIEWPVKNSFESGVFVLKEIKSVP